MSRQFVRSLTYKVMGMMYIMGGVYLVGVIPILIILWLFCWIVSTKKGQSMDLWELVIDYYVLLYLWSAFVVVLSMICIFYIGWSTKGSSLTLVLCLFTFMTGVYGMELLLVGLSRDSVMLAVWIMGVVLTGGYPGMWQLIYLKEEIEF